MYMTFARRTTISIYKNKIAEVVKTKDETNIIHLLAK